MREEEKQQGTLPGWLYLRRTFLLSVLSCLLSSGTCCIYEVERISNGKRVSLGESSKSLSLYFLFPFLLSNPLRRYRIQKETGQRQVFPCSATEMRKTCTRISFSIHNSQDSEFESAFGTNFNDNSRRGANRKRTSQCKDIEAGHNVKMPPRFSSAYLLALPLPLSLYYSLPSTPFSFHSHSSWLPLRDFHNLCASIHSS